MHYIYVLWLKTILFIFYIFPLRILAFSCISYYSTIEIYPIDVNPIEVYPIEAYLIGKGPIEAYLIGKGAIEVSGCSRFWPLKGHIVFTAPLAGT